MAQATPPQMQAMIAEQQRRIMHQQQQQQQQHQAQPHPHQHQHQHPHPHSHPQGLSSQMSPIGGRFPGPSPIHGGPGVGGPPFGPGVGAGIGGGGPPGGSPFMPGPPGGMMPSMSPGQGGPQPPGMFLPGAGPSGPMGGGIPGPGGPQMTPHLFPQGSHMVPPQSSPAAQAANRKRKKADGAGSASGRASQAAAIQQQRAAAAAAAAAAQQQHQHHLQRPKPSSGMGIGTIMEDDGTEFLLDELDRLTSRDLAVARYKRNHELLNAVFDARRIAGMVPPPSPYKKLDGEKLKSDHERLIAEVEELRGRHTEKIGRIRAAPATGGISSAGEDGQGEHVEGWAVQEDGAKILGVGYVRAVTPDDIRARNLEQQARQKQLREEEEKAQLALMQAVSQGGAKKEPLHPTLVIPEPGRTAASLAEESEAIERANLELDPEGSGKTITMAREYEKMIKAHKEEVAAKLASRKAEEEKAQKERQQQQLSEQTSAIAPTPSQPTSALAPPSDPPALSSAIALAPPSDAPASSEMIVPSSSTSAEVPAAPQAASTSLAPTVTDASAAPSSEISALPSDGPLEGSSSATLPHDAVSSSAPDGAAPSGQIESEQGGSDSVGEIPRAAAAEELAISLPSSSNTTEALPPPPSIATGTSAQAEESSAPEAEAAAPLTFPTGAKQTLQTAEVKNGQATALEDTDAVMADEIAPAVAEKAQERAVVEPAEAEAHIEVIPPMTAEASPSLEVPHPPLPEAETPSVQTTEVPATSPPLEDTTMQDAGDSIDSHASRAAPAPAAAHPDLPALTEGSAAEAEGGPEPSDEKEDPAQQAGVEGVADSA